MISIDMPVPSCIICGCSGKNSMSHYEEEEGEGGIIFHSSHRVMMLESLHLQGKPLHVLRESLGHLRVLRETNDELKVAMEGSLSHVVNNNTGDASRRAGAMLLKASIAKTYRRNKDQRAVLDALKKKMHSDILGIQTVCQCLDDSRAAGIQHQERSEVLQQTIAGLRQQCKEQSKILHSARLQLSVKVFKLFSVTVSPCYRDHICAIAIDQEQQLSGAAVRVAAEGPSRLQRSTRGFSCIMNVPLPNDGDYSDVPLDVLILTLTHIAHLVDTVSSILNAPLMHPIHLEEGGGSTSPSISISSRTNPNVYYALVQDRDPKSVRCLDESSYSVCCETDYAGRMIDKIVVARSDKGEHHLNAIDDSCTWGRHHSRYGLHLLQQDVILLCLDCGMAPSNLWPPEALLLNISSLQRFLECDILLSHSNAGDSDLQLQHDSETMAFMEDSSSFCGTHILSGSESIFHYKSLSSETLSNAPSRRSSSRVFEAHKDKYLLIDAVRKAMSPSGSDN